MYQRLSVILTACVALVAAGCLDNGNNDGDSGVQRDSTTQTDAQTQRDAAPGLDASTTCTLQDLFDQFMCGAGRKCTLIDGTTNVGCADAGFTPAYGGCDPTFPDTCEVGSLCSNQAGSYRCLPFCTEPDTFCDGGRCGTTAIATSGSDHAYLCEPADNCNPVTTNPLSSGCDTGEGCYVASVGAGMTFCEPQGTNGAEQNCLDDFDCVQGYACFGGGPMQCRKVCRKDTDADCPSGQSCGPLNDDYGLCF